MDFPDSYGRFSRRRQRLSRGNGQARVNVRNSEREIDIQHSTNEMNAAVFFITPREEISEELTGERGSGFESEDNVPVLDNDEAQQAESDGNVLVIYCSTRRQARERDAIMSDHCYGHAVAHTERQENIPMLQQTGSEPTVTRQEREQNIRVASRSTGFRRAAACQERQENIPMLQQTGSEPTVTRQEREQNIRVASRSTGFRRAAACQERQENIPMLQQTGSEPAVTRQEREQNIRVASRSTGFRRAAACQERQENIPMLQQTGSEPAVTHQDREQNIPILGRYWFGFGHAAARQEEREENIPIRIPQAGSEPSVTHQDREQNIPILGRYCFGFGHAAARQERQENIPMRMPQASTDPAVTRQGRELNIPVSRHFGFGHAVAHQAREGFVPISHQIISEQAVAPQEREQNDPFNLHHFDSGNTVAGQEREERHAVETREENVIHNHGSRTRYNIFGNARLRVNATGYIPFYEDGWEEVTDLSPPRTESNARHEFVPTPGPSIFCNPLIPSSPAIINIPAVNERGSGTNHSLLSNSVQRNFGIVHPTFGNTAQARAPNDIETRRSTLEYPPGFRPDYPPGFRPDYPPGFRPSTSENPTSNSVPNSVSRGLSTLGNPFSHNSEPINFASMRRPALDNTTPASSCYNSQNSEPIDLASMRRPSTFGNTTPDLNFFNSEVRLFSYDNPFSSVVSNNYDHDGTDSWEDDPGLNGVSYIENIPSFGNTWITPTNVVDQRSFGNQSQATCTVTEEMVSNSSQSSSRTNNTEPMNCVICLDATPTFAVIPCGHMHLCAICAFTYRRRSTRCPSCRQPFTSIIRIYGPNSN